MRPAPCLLALALLAVACRGTSPDSSPQAPAGDAQPRTAADRKAFDRVPSIQATLAELRERPFTRDVVAGFYTRDQLRDFLLEALAEEMPPEKAEAWERSVKAFGLVPREVDLMQTILDAYTAQIGGFYDPKTDRLYCITSELGLLNNFVMVHEIVHAQQDLYVDLETFIEAVQDQDDATFASSAVVEGEAQFVTNRYLALDGNALFDPEDPVDGRALMKEAMSQMASQAGTLPYLMEVMLYPYVQGEVMIGAAYDRGGWPAVDALWARPPASTEQVLHPEKLPGGEAPDPPQPVRVPDVSAALGDGYAPVARNVLGELQTHVMVKLIGDMGQSYRASYGWDGDEYRVYGAEGRPDVLQWLSVWDTEQDAVELVEALAGILERQGHTVELDEARDLIVIEGDDGRVLEWIGREDAWVLWLRDLPAGADLDAIVSRCLP